jgi:hypothetical protein
MSQKKLLVVSGTVVATVGLQLFVADKFGAFDGWKADRKSPSLRPVAKDSVLLKAAQHRPFGVMESSYLRRMANYAPMGMKTILSSREVPPEQNPGVRVEPNILVSPPPPRSRLSQGIAILNHETSFHFHRTVKR